MKRKLISIVLPAYNEEESVETLIHELKLSALRYKNYLFEFIFVENGSEDQTLKKLLSERKKDSRVKILQLSRNFGCDTGIMAGLTVAKGDAAIVMMSDLQDKPSDIGKFIEKWEQGYDVVYAIVTKRSGIHIYKIFGAYIFFKLMHFISGNLIPENATDFRLLDKAVYRVLIRMPEHNKFFRGISTWAGFSQVGIPITRAKRITGKSKADLKTLFKVGTNGIFAYSNLPLRVGWVCAVLFFALGIFSFLVNKAIAIIMFAFFVITIQIAIQGEYILRIIDEVRQRPNFIVKASYGLSHNL